MIIGSAIAVLIAIFLLMQAALRGWRLAVLAFALLPVALAGGAVAALIDGGYALGSLIGFLAVLGIAARNGLVLIRHFQDLERYDGEAFGPQLVRRGVQERFAPIVTSATALGAVALLFVILGSKPGLEIVQPMAVVILGGLVTTTLVSLFVVPTLYLRFGARQQALSPEEELMHRWVAGEPAPAQTGAGTGAGTTGVSSSAEATGDGESRAR
jgi:Cu/Ag efflux pump CusA